MNAKLLLKALFITLVVMLLVLMGMHNRSTVEFILPPVLTTYIKQPAAIMYVAFFGLGLLSGTILFAGGGKKGGAKAGKGEK
jgi:uncharacterized integral membrane protein